MNLAIRPSDKDRPRDRAARRGIGNAASRLRQARGPNLFARGQLNSRYRTGYQAHIKILPVCRAAPNKVGIACSRFFGYIGLPDHGALAIGIERKDDAAFVRGQQQIAAAHCLQNRRRAKIPIGAGIVRAVFGLVLAKTTAQGCVIRLGLKNATGVCRCPYRQPK